MSSRLIVSEIFQDDGVNEEGLAGSAEPFLFVLPSAGRRALLSLSELLTYDATWVELTTDGRQQREALTDRQTEIIEATRNGLMEVEQVNLIVAKLEEIREEIELLRLAQEGQELIEDDLQDMVSTLGTIAVVLGV